MAMAVRRSFGRQRRAAAILVAMLLCLIPAASSSSSSSYSSSSGASSVTPASSSSSSSAAPSSSAAAPSSSSTAASSSAAPSSSTASSSAAAPSSSSSSAAAAAATTPTVPVGVVYGAFPATLRGGDVVTVDFGTPQGEKSLVSLVLLDADGTTVLSTIYGPDVYPAAGANNYVLPVLVDVKPNVLLRVITVNTGAEILEPAECQACTSGAFTLQLGGAAADASKVTEAENGPPAGNPGTQPIDDVLFYFQISKKQGETLTAEDAKQALLAIDLNNVTPAQARNLVAAFDDVYDEQAGRPSVEEVDKTVALVDTYLDAKDGVAPVLSKADSDTVISAIRKMLVALLRSSSKKFANQLTAAETAANVAQRLVEQLRQAAAQSAAAAGAINLNNVCSAVVTVNTGGNFCQGGNFPHDIALAGVGLPVNTHRVTAVALTLAQMDAGDQTLTTTLDLTAAVSPHYSAIATPTTSEGTAHTLASKFTTANVAGAQAANANYNCFQRIATNNGEPSGTYAQLAAASQTRDATSVTCTGANAGQIRWVTLASATAQPQPQPVAAGSTTPTTAAAAPTTPSTAIAAAATPTNGSDDSNTSALVGGILGGVGGLIIVGAIVGLLLLKAKHQRSRYGADNYWQGDGVYKGPIATPNAPW